MRDVEFLAQLVHRGHLRRPEAERLLPDLKDGVPLDRLLVEEVGWSEAFVARLRRTRAGELPEIPGFEIRRRLGVGGTAEVFEALERRAGRVLALKVLKREFADRAATRKAFIAEGRLLERLAHPGLVRGFGVARSGTLYFSKLERIEGETVLERLDGGEPFSEEQALRVVLEVAEALSYLESCGVVHRDVKPGNIMLRRDGSAVLIDLGFAAPEAAANAGDQAVGTVHYLSPEQARGGAAADSRSDIYSLGISLFHMVCGRLPFESSDDREVLRMQVMESLRSPELKCRNVSPHLHYFVEKMVAKEADHRYQSWAGLIEDVRGQLEGRADLDFESQVRTRRRG